MASKSAGQWIGSIVGAVIGYFVPGSYVALGAALGGAIGGIIDPPKGPRIEGPRLSDLNVQTSSYGNPIPRVYGTVAMAGNVFWIENNQLTEHEKTEEQGGKGGGGGATSTSWWYSVTFGLGLCEGPIVGVKRIWCSGKLLYDGSATTAGAILSNAGVASGFTVYTGTETQTACARMEATLGAGNVPGYRGMAYIVFEDFDLSDYGNSLMGAQFKVEVVTAGVEGITYTTANVIPEDFSTAGKQLVSAVMTATKVDYLAMTMYVPTSTPVALLGYTAEYGIVQRQTSAVDIAFAGATYLPHLITATQSDRPVCVFYYWPTGGAYPTHMGIVGLDYDSSEFIRTLTPVGELPTTFDACCVEGSTVWAGSLGQKICRFQGGTMTAQTAANYTTDRIGYSENYLFAVLNASTGSTTTVYKFNKATLDLVDTFVGSVPVSYSPIYVVSDTELYTVTNGTLYRWIDGVPESMGDLYNGYDFGAVRPHWFYATPNFSVNIQELGTGAGDEAVLMAARTLTSTTVELSDIIESECLLSGLLDAADIDVTAISQDVRGYRVTQVAAIRSGLEPLQGAWPFDIIQNGYAIKFIPRGGASIGTVTADELGAAAPEEKDVIRITEVREQDSQLARRAVLTYLDDAREYDVSEQSAERLNTDSVNIRTIEMPIVLSADEAAQMVERLLYMWWLERRDLSFTLPPTWAHLQPADVVTVQTGSATLEARIVQCQYLPDGRVEISAKYNDAPVYVSTAVGASPPYTGQTLGVPGSSLLSLLDIPCVDSSYMNTPGLLAGVSGYVSAWTGGVLFRSSDGGQTYQSLQAFAAPGVVAGYTTNALAAGVTHVIDAANSVNVRMLSGTIESASLASVLSGANHFALGAHGRWEIIAALTATEESDGSITLTNLLRGRFGTEQYGATHAALEQIVALDSAKLRVIGLAISELNVSRLWRAVTAGSNFDSADDTAFAYNGINLKPLSPIRLNGSRNPATLDWTLTVVPRSRTPVEPFSGVDTPVGESSQAYEVEIWNSDYSTLLRTITGLTSPTTQYTNAQQVTDYGSTVATVYTRWYQMSATLGRGYVYQSSITRSMSTDPYLPFNRLLVNCTTDLTDATGRHTVTATGNAAVSGGYCVFDGSGDYLYLDGSADFAPTGDFTVEMYFTPTSMSETHTLWDSRPTSTNGSYIALFVDTAGACSLYVASATRITSASGAVSNNTEYHIALCRSGSSNRLFINGTQVGSTWSDSRSYSNAANRPVLITNGADTGNTIYHTQCKLRGIRFTAYARYTATFTPPTMPLPTS